MDQNPKQQLVERIKGATNILITVSANPTVDQLAACIGFTLLLNKFNKHATAVFSGNIPSTIEFLQPEKTLETNTDSLQDFIIALDKSKADKLRYKVEDDVVRIFITPYRTSIGQKDLEFSQGDFNVDVVVALGVTKKEDIDQAIISHGRILHDAVVVSVTGGEVVSDVGSINWNDPAASSLSEMLVSVSESFQSGLLDGQMATAFLTGIVAETERFSNAKTSPKVMTMSAQLMAAGANQQLIATELAPPAPIPAVVEPEVPVVPQEPWVAPVAPIVAPATQAPAQAEASLQPAPPIVAPASEPAAEPKNSNSDGEVLIKHHEDQPEPEPVNEDEIHIDEQGNLKKQTELEAADLAARKKATDETALALENAAAAIDASAQAAVDADPMAPAAPTPLDASEIPAIPDVPTPTVPEPAPQQAAPLPDLAQIAPADTLVQTPPKGGVTPSPHELVLQPLSAQPSLALPPLDPSALSNQPVTLPPAGDSLTNLEEAVQSPHLDQPATVDEVAARAAVASANTSSAYRPEPVQSLGAMYVDINAPAAAAPAPAAPAPATGIAEVLQQQSSSLSDAHDPMAPPPVPPPMTPPFFSPTTTHHNPYLNPAAAEAAEDDEPKSTL